jgi:hypothetical protein
MGMVGFSGEMVRIDDPEKGLIFTAQICRECSHKARAIRDLPMAIQELHAWSLLVNNYNPPLPEYIQEAFSHAAKRVADLRQYERDLKGEKV